MVAQFFTTSDFDKAQLLSGLKLIPLDWALTPVLGNKNPYRADWNHAIPMSRRQLIAVIENGDTASGKNGLFTVYPQGYGLRTGKWSNGILALDADGDAAHEKLNQLGGLPKTVSFTSGKPGRCQYLVRVPQEYWSVISTKKINTGVKGADGKDQLLELRWNGCQSVLPPSVHPETGSYKWVNSPQDCALAECPTWIIEYFLNESTTVTTNSTSTTLITDDVPLYQCLTKDDRDLIDCGVASGSRDNNGAKLARNLIGTASRLTHLGYRYEGDARQLFDDYCARCSPPLSTKDAERIWKSATKDNPSATLSDDALLNCIKAWHRNQSQGISHHQGRASAASTLRNAITDSTTHSTHANTTNNVVLHPTVTINYDALKSEYIKLLEAGASKSELSRFKAEVGKEYYPIKLDRFLSDVETEHRTAEDDELIKEDIQLVLDSDKHELDIRQFLPEKLATALMLFGINQSLPQTSLMMSLISVISASHLIGTQVLIGNKHNEFYQNPAINHALVGDSGSGKSIIFRALVKKPLNALRKAENKRYLESSQQYEKDLVAWEQSGESTSQPEPPKPINRMYLTGATLEGLKDYIAKAPDYSILNVVDELSGLFGGFNQYKRGQGNDRQEFLSLYDGDGFSEAKVSKNIFVEKSNTAWLGGLQPTILHKYFQLGASDGLLPRFTFSVLPEIIRLLPDENASCIDVTGILTGLYKAILDCQPQTYHITGEAYKYFRDVDTKWQYEAAKLPNGALKEFLKKCKGLLGRLSLNLHLIHELSNPYCGTPPTVIPLMRVKQAAGIIEHLLKQIQAVHLQIAGETTSSAIVAMINLSVKRQSLGEEGWLNAREISRHQSAKGRMKSLEIRELMTKAKDMGYGELRGSGTKLEFRSSKFVGELSANGLNAAKLNIAMVLSPEPQKMSAVVGCLSATDEILKSNENTGFEPSNINFVGDVGENGANSENLAGGLDVGGLGISDLTQGGLDVGERLAISDLAQGDLDVGGLEISDLTQGDLDVGGLGISDLAQGDLDVGGLGISDLTQGALNVGSINLGDSPPLNRDENISLIAPTSPTNSPLEAPTLDTEPVGGADNSPTQSPTQSPTKSSTQAKTHVRQEEETADILPTVPPTVADSCQQQIDIDNINYSDYKSVVTALQKACMLGEGYQMAVGKIYASSCSNVQILIADSATIPSQSKQYILACYEWVLNEMTQD